MYDKFSVPLAAGVGITSEIEAGAVASPPGVAEVEAKPLPPSPSALNALTRKMYAVPFARPELIVAVVPLLPVFAYALVQTVGFDAAAY